jgi:hypothetical protein
MATATAAISSAQPRPLSLALGQPLSSAHGRGLGRHSQHVWGGSGRGQAAARQGCGGALAGKGHGATIGAG